MLLYISFSPVPGVMVHPDWLIDHEHICATAKVLPRQQVKCVGSRRCYGEPPWDNTPYSELNVPLTRASSSIYERHMLRTMHCQSDIRQSFLCMSKMPYLFTPRRRESIITCRLNAHHSLYIPSRARGSVFGQHCAHLSSYKVGYSNWNHASVFSLSASLFSPSGW